MKQELTDIVSTLIDLHHKSFVFEQREGTATVHSMGDFGDTTTPVMVKIEFPSIPELTTVASFSFGGLFERQSLQKLRHLLERDGVLSIQTDAPFSGLRYYIISTGRNGSYERCQLECPENCYILRAKLRSAYKWCEVCDINGSSPAAKSIGAMLGRALEDGHDEFCLRINDGALWLDISGDNKIPAYRIGNNLGDLPKSWHSRLFMGSPFSYMAAAAGDNPVHISVMYVKSDLPTSGDTDRALIKYDFNRSVGTTTFHYQIYYEGIME